MSTEYEPGTVAVATVRGRAGVRVMRSADDDGWGWVTADKVETWRVHEDRLVHDVRPLVVLDLAVWLPEAISQIPAWLREKAYDAPSESALRHIADQIEAQTKPPRIPEPGLWGVVEAFVSDSGGSRWNFVRDTDQGSSEWTCVNNGDHYDWESLIDPALIREGVES